MAKKNQKIEVENIELKPQVIGKIEKKKNNIGRVLIIFIVFIFTIIFLPEITIFLNNKLGMKISPTIVDNKEETDNKPNNNNPTSNNEIEYILFNENTEIKKDDYIVNSFSLINNQLSFNIQNTLDKSLDLSKDLLYLETYNESKTLIERFKIDLEPMGAKKSQSVKVILTNPNIYYVSFVSKTTNDYPVVDLTKNDLGYATMTCKSGNDTIIYTFKNDELVTVKEEVIYNFNVLDQNYSSEFSKYQSKCTNYDVINGVNTSFNNSTNGFTAVIEVDMAILEKDKLDEKYYYSYKEVPKVIKFEMETYGYKCE